MTIPIGVIGRILNAGMQEPYILVQDDLSNTGGYLVLQSNDPAFITGHDSWVLENELYEFFRDSGWEIEWPESNGSLPEKRLL